MANFCVICGKPTEEGQICSCQQVQQPQQQEQQPMQQPQQQAQQPMQQTPYQAPQQQVQYVTVQKGPSAAGELISRSIKIISDFVVNPVGTIKSVSEKKDYVAGLVFLVLQALASGIFALFNCIRQAGEFNGANFEVSGYFKALFSGLFIDGAKYFLIAFLLFGAAAVLFKASESLKSIIAFVGVATIPLTLILLFNSMFTFIYYSGTTYILSFATIASYILCFVGFRDTVKIDENKAFYSTAITFVLILIVISVISNKVGSFGPVFSGTGGEIPSYGDILDNIFR